MLSLEKAREQPAPGLLSASRAQELDVEHSLGQESPRLDSLTFYDVKQRRLRQKTSSIGIYHGGGNGVSVYDSMSGNCCSK